MGTRGEERLVAGGWAVLCAGLMAEVGIQILFSKGDVPWVARAAAMSIAFLVGIGLSRRLWLAARATSYWRGALWGTVGSLFTAHAGTLLYVVVGTLLEGGWSRFDDDLLEIVVSMLAAPTVLGWWLVVPSGVIAGCVFVAIFPRRTELVLE